MASDLYTIISFCKRALGIVEAIGEECQWVQNNLDFPHVGSQADTDRAFNIVCSAAEITEMCDQLRADLDSYIRPYDSDYARLGLSADQIQVVELFVLMTDERPLGIFQGLYVDMGRPERRPDAAERIME